MPVAEFGRKLKQMGDKFSDVSDTSCNLYKRAISHQRQNAFTMQCSHKDLQNAQNIHACMHMPVFRIHKKYASIHA